MKIFQGAARLRGTHHAPTLLAISPARCGCEKRRYIASSAKKMYDCQGSHLCEHTIKRPPSLDGTHAPAHTPPITTQQTYTQGSFDIRSVHLDLDWLVGRCCTGFTLSQKIIGFYGCRACAMRTCLLRHADAPSDPPRGEIGRRPRTVNGEGIDTRCLCVRGWRCKRLIIREL
jgi:hypothetical protein